MRHVKVLGLALLAGSLALGLVTGCGQPSKPPTAGGKSVNADSLYMRIGGEAGIRGLVDALLTKVTQDERINGRFKSVDVPRFKARLVAFLGQATGGPQIYTGKDMKSAHKGLQETTADWKAFMEDLTAAMAVQKIPALEQQELLVVLEPMKRDIVTQ